MTLPPDFEQRLRAVGLALDEPQRLAHDVMALSDFYLQHPGAPTPWHEPYAANAYLAYFLPLNLVRLRAVLREVRRFLPHWQEAHDFGAGVGTWQWALEAEGFAPRPLFAIENASPAVKLYQKLLHAAPATWQAQFRAAPPGPGALAVYSYSYLEMRPSVRELAAFEHILLVEPSTRECGRALMETRARWIEQGYTPLAPCTHAQACPLLTESARDWCHMRVPFAAPTWFANLEDHLPMKNRTLTYSYLLLSRTARDAHWRGQARVIGDTLSEKGKTRQMICRGPHREFLSWLHKHGPAPQIPHGALLRGTEQAEAKGTELRPPPDSLQWEI